MNANSIKRKMMAGSVELSVFVIRLYRWLISPFLGSNCRFYPSCSTYAEEALRSKGMIRGLYMTVKRILKCQPFHPGGVDVVK